MEKAFPLLCDLGFAALVVSARTAPGADCNLGTMEVPSRLQSLNSETRKNSNLW